MVHLQLLVVVLTLFVAGYANADGAVGVDIPGGDLVQVTASSATTCAQQCDGHTGCVGWAWDSCGGVTCWLKSSIGARTAQSCRVSDVRQGDAGVDRTGYDLPNMPANLGATATASTCAYRCLNTTGCVAWTWTSPNCWMKWWAAPTTAAGSTVFSGVQGTTGLDFPGIGDFQSVTLANSGTTTDCAKQCESNAGCYAWTHAVASASCPTTANNCWLKSFAPGQGKTNVSCVAGGYASRFFNTSVPRTNVTVASITLVGNQTDPSLAPVYPDRDGGAVGTLGGKIVWVWSDTDYTNRNTGGFAGFYGNTGAIGTPNNPLLMKGPERQAIPFSAPELAFNNNHSYNPRVVLWPKSGVVEISPGNGLIWVPKGYWGQAINGSEPNSGIELASVVIGSDGYASYTRLSDTPLFDGKVPGYGNVAAVRDQNYVYLYGANRIATYSAPVYLARAPLTSATTLSSYEYYNAGAKKWSSVAPNPSTNTSYAIFGSTFGVDGNVYYSSYHRAWVLIYNPSADYHIYMRTAPAPEGPWSEGKLIYSPPPSPSVTYVYGTTGTNLYDTTGQTSSVDFTWCYSGGYANWVVQVNFA